MGEESITYECVECGEPAEVVAGEIIRTCACPVDTGVTAALSATVYGIGSMQS